ncbi:Hypothetical predicted protein [Olea europaea subsp. europaea]|uniref:Uncharacterized protein n=1 Tax=Olea europaea subsp. europaea TaxID=158383 RepID=A0A8S0SVF2_OLEEU|nr:Hypothetical predicted protein [Olea europaea subsp. europaea]
MNSPEVGEVDDEDVGHACHLRGSLRKPVYDGVDSSGDSVMDNVDIVEAQVGANDQPVEQIRETPTSDIPCSVENEAGVEVANDELAGFTEPSTIGRLEDPADTQFEQPTFEGTTRLEDLVDTQFEQPTFEGATGMEDLGNVPVEPSVEEAINAQNTGTGSSGGELEVEEKDNDSGLEHFFDSEYEQEDVEEDDQGEDTFFRLSDGLDFGLGNVSN